MKVVLTNLSNSAFQESRFRLNNSARRFGIEQINSYDFDDIKPTPFYARNKEILDIPTGAGCWLWKPYIILETLNSLDDGDVVVYADSGLEFIAPIDKLIDICKLHQPLLLFANGNLPNSMWTKRDCFVLMNCDNKKYWRSIQSDGAFALFRKCPETIQFVQEWLQYGTDKRIITDMPNTLGKRNLPDFVEHRRDQSILSLLAVRHQVPFYRMPTQYGNHYKLPEYRVANEFNQVNQYFQKPVNYYAARPFENSPYGQLLNHHRSRSAAVAQKAGTSNPLKNIPARIKRNLYQLWCRVDAALFN
jgi:hypothetical protein